MQAGYYLGKRQIEIRACVPRDPASDEVQIRMSHCGICGSDLHVYLGDLDHRIQMPEVIGHEGAGAIAKLGANVTGFREGERVAVMPIVSCGECRACRDGFYHVCQKLQIIGIERPGAMQSFWTVPAANLFRRLRWPRWRPSTCGNSPCRPSTPFGRATSPISARRLGIPATRCGFTERCAASENRSASRRRRSGG